MITILPPGHPDIPKRRTNRRMVAGAEEIGDVVEHLRAGQVITVPFPPGLTREQIAASIRRRFINRLDWQAGTSIVRVDGELRVAVWRAA